LLDGTDFIAHVRRGETQPEALPVTVELAAELAPAATSARMFPSSAGSKKLDLPLLRSALPQLVEGVHALHQLGMLHRDIKPSNVMVTREGRVVLLDFGLVRPATNLEAASGRLSLESSQPIATAIVGTPEYMSPEQSLGDELTPASDWYSVGTVLFEALTGRRPFVGTIAEIVAERQYHDAPLPSRFAENIPAELDELVGALLRRDPQRRPTASQIARVVGASLGGTISSSVSDLLVGREEALATLREALNETAQGHPVVCEVYGASGVGKSALAARFLEEARQSRGALVFAGRCDERKTVPFKALDGVVDALAMNLRARSTDELAVLLPKSMDALEQLFPVLAMAPTGLKAKREPRADAGSSDQLVTVREEAFAALRELLTRASTLRPIIIAIDDLQWSDVDSAQLLRELITGADAPNVLLVATVRGQPGQVETPFDLIEQNALDRRLIELTPLDETESVSLARSLLSRSARSDADARRIAVEAQGNPFFLGELVRYSIEHPERSLAITSLDDVVLARVRALPADARTMLELVAVIGQAMPQRVLFNASQLGPSAYPALRALRTANMVRYANAGEGDRVEPYHDRVRESVVRTLSAEELRARHRAIAAALEADPESDPGLRAEHLAGAHELERAARAALEAAQHAERTFAFDRAARWYQAVLEWRPVNGVERGELLARLAHALVSCGRNAAAADAFAQAAELCADPMRALELRRHSGVQLFIEGRHEDGVRTLGVVAKELGVRIPDSRLGLSAGLVADTVWLRLRGLRFKERPEREIDARTLQRLDMLHYAGLGTAFADSMLSMWYLTRFTRAAIDVGEPVRVGLALLRYSTTVAVGGPSNEARALEILRAAEELSSRHRDPYLRGCLDMAYGFTDLMMGRWAQANARCERAVELLLQVPGAVWDADTAASLATEALMNQGRIAAAFRRTMRQERDSKARNFVAGLVRNALRWESLRRVMLDDVDGARAVIEAAAQRIPSSTFLFGHFLEILGRTQLAVYEGEGARTLSWLRGRWPALERSLMLRAPVFRTSMFVALGRLLLLSARGLPTSERTALAREADALGRKLESEDAVSPRALGGSLRACAAIILGDDRSSLSMYRSSLQLFETADMHLHAAAARLAIASLVGGDEGAELSAIGRRAFIEQGVRDPSKFAAVFVAQPLF
jgi:tetratricopeptide (TPR) repeat protein